jgi:hypothetical protein
LLFFTSTSSTAVSTTQKRTGTYSYAIQANTTKNLSAISEIYFRIPVWCAGDMNNNAIQLRKGTTIIGSVGRNATSGLLEIRIGTTLTATGSIVITKSTWVSIEWHLKIADSGGISEVKVDGIADVTTGLTDTKPGADTTVDNLYISANTGAGTLYIDDIAINDTTGGVDDSWCGDGKVIILTPNAAGDATQWSTFPTGTANYADVDDIPSDSDTTYVYSSGTNAYDLYNLPASGLSNVTINRVWAEARAKDTVAEGGTVSLLLKTNDMIATGSSQSLLTTYTKQVLGDVYTTNPQSGVAWSVVELDALQVGQMVRG